VFLLHKIMGKILQNDLRYGLLSRLPRNKDGIVKIRTKSFKFVLTVLQIDNLLMKVLFKYHKNLLGETCVSFEHSVM